MAGNLPTIAAAVAENCNLMLFSSTLLHALACFNILSLHFLLLLQIAKKSNDLRPHVDAWEKRMAAVTTFIDQNKNLPSESSSSESSSSSDDDEEKEGDEETDSALCAHCKPPKATG